MNYFTFPPHPIAFCVSACYNSPTTSYLHKKEVGSLMNTKKKSSYISLDDLKSNYFKYNPMEFNISGVFAGYQRCPIVDPASPSHTWGPIIRDYFALDYITKGHGVLTLNGIDHPMHAGQVYLTFPGTMVTMYTERPEPWEYYYLFFRSPSISKYLRALNFSEITPVFAYDNLGDELIPCFKKLMELYESDCCNPFDQTLHVCKIFSTLAKYVSKYDANNVFGSTDNFIEKALQYFDINYPNKISISDVASALGLDRSYFSRMFKQYMETSPQEYLMRLRMKKACEFLIEPKLSISNIAYSVGYEPFTFSRTFKQIIGVSPSEYRENLKK